MTSTATKFLAAALATTVATAALAAGARAQTVALLGRYDPAGQRGSDVWHWVDPDSGREFALACAFDGLHVLDCSDPTAPVRTGLIPTDNPGSSGNRWRDVKTFGSYAYVVSEAHGGVQIVDLRDPDAPRLVRTFGASLWSSTHNIAIDTAAGTAWVCGTNNGMHVLDLNADPENPSRIAVYGTAYVHDLAVQDGLAHTAEINSNRYTILATDALPSLPNRATVTSAGRASCHSVWPSRDNAIAAVCHETSGGEVVVYDVSDPRLPRVRSIFQTGGPQAIVHNPVIADRICHVSWNTEGYVALDLSDPGRPVVVGQWDTWSGSSSGFNGLWGISGVQPSGVVYGMDRTAGFFAWKPLYTMRHYGDAGAGAPALHAFGSAWRGNGAHRIDVAGAPAGANGVLIVGTAPASQPAAGITLRVDLGQPHLLLPFTADADGEARVPLPIQEGFATGALYSQALVLDAGAPAGITATGGAEWNVFALGG